MERAKSPILTEFWKECSPVIQGFSIPESMEGCVDCGECQRGPCPKSPNSNFCIPGDEHQPLSCSIILASLLRTEMPHFLAGAAKLERLFTVITPSWSWAMVDGMLACKGKFGSSSYSTPLPTHSKYHSEILTSDANQRERPA